MTTDSTMPVPEAKDRQATHARLQRIFLWTLVASFTLGALTAVVALLTGGFNQTTGRILGTLAALATHSGVAMACAASLERRLWPRLSFAGLWLFAASFVVLISCIWVPQLIDERVVQAIGSSIALLGAYVLAIPSADLLERGRQQLLARVALLADAIAFLSVLVLIWADPWSWDSENLARSTAIAGIIAFSFAQTSLLVRIPGAGVLIWLLRGVVTCLWAVAVVSSGMIIWEPRDDIYVRILGALGVLDAAGSLTLLIMAKLRRVGRVEKLQSASARLELRCPRCTVLQTLETGESKCTSCGLKFHIQIDEPRCAKCNYLLWQLPERRCPECGTTF